VESDEWSHIDRRITDAGVIEVDQPHGAMPIPQNAVRPKVAVTDNRGRDVFDSL
jgi:hypothetical protein